MEARRAEFQSTLSSRRATLDRFFLGEKFLISIHALLAESDVAIVLITDVTFHISIHALLAESDRGGTACRSTGPNFNPRSPCGERPIRATSSFTFASFQSTLSLRRATGSLSITQTGAFLFQSTLSLRRATGLLGHRLGRLRISIHALLAESDGRNLGMAQLPRPISIHALLAESDSKYHQIGPIVSV